MNIFGFETPTQFEFPISAICNWYKQRKVKQDIDNIKKWGSDYGDYKCNASDNGTTDADCAGKRIDENCTRHDGNGNGGRKEKDGARRDCGDHR